MFGALHFLWIDGKQVHYFRRRRCHFSYLCSMGCGQMPLQYHTHNTTQIYLDTIGWHGWLNTSHSRVLALIKTKGIIILSRLWDTEMTKMRLYITFYWSMGNVGTSSSRQVTRLEKTSFDESPGKTRLSAGYEKYHIKIT